MQFNPKCDDDGRVLMSLVYAPRLGVPAVDLFLRYTEIGNEYE